MDKRAKSVGPASLGLLRIIPRSWSRWGSARLPRMTILSPRNALPRRSSESGRERARLRFPRPRSVGSAATVFACRAAPSEDWWSRAGSNRRPHPCEGCALPAELLPHLEIQDTIGLAAEQPHPSWRPGQARAMPVLSRRRSTATCASPSTVAQEAEVSASGPAWHRASADGPVASLGVQLGAARNADAAPAHPRSVDGGEET